MFLLLVKPFCARLRILFETFFSLLFITLERTLYVQFKREIGLQFFISLQFPFFGISLIAAVLKLSVRLFLIKQHFAYLYKGILKKCQYFF